MRNCPWFGMPMMSPAHASSANSRSAARNRTGFDTAIGFLLRTCSSFMPRLKCPDANRTKATRSRCFGSILACTLKTKPETLDSSGATWRGSADWICGSGPYFPMPSINSLTPKELIADPNQMGVMCPSRTAWGSRVGSSSRAISTSSRNFSKRWSGTCSFSLGSSNPLISTLSATRFLSARSINSNRSFNRS